MRKLIASAADHGSFVRIDMEDSKCTTATLRVYETLRADDPDRVGIVLGHEFEMRLCEAAFPD